eukprot:757914-Prymnesium_polylepis.1
MEPLCGRATAGVCFLKARVRSDCARSVVGPSQARGVARATSSSCSCTFWARWNERWDEWIPAFSRRLKAEEPDEADDSDESEEEPEEPDN